MSWKQRRWRKCCCENYKSKQMMTVISYIQEKKTEKKALKNVQVLIWSNWLTIRLVTQILANLLIFHSFTNSWQKWCLSLLIYCTIHQLSGRNWINNVQNSWVNIGHKKANTFTKYLTQFDWKLVAFTVQMRSYIMITRANWELCKHTLNSLAEKSVADRKKVMQNLNAFIRSFSVDVIHNNLNIIGINEISPTNNPNITCKLCVIRLFVSIRIRFLFG